MWAALRGEKMHLGTAASFVSARADSQKLRDFGEAVSENQGLLGGRQRQHRLVTGFLPTPGATAAAGGAAAGAMMYMFCKSKCPGEKSLAEQIADAKAKLGGMLCGGISKLSGGAGGEGDNDDEKKIEEEESEADPFATQIDTADNSACRLSCKLNSIMAAAATAGVITMAKATRPKAKTAATLDGWTTGAVFAILQKREEEHCRRSVQHRLAMFEFLSPDPSSNSTSKQQMADKFLAVL